MTTRSLDNNHLERQIKRWAMGLLAWQFIESELAGQRATVMMNLVQSARVNENDRWAYLRDALARLPPQPNSQPEELLPHQ